MIKGKVYEGGSIEVYAQHCDKPSSLEYSEDKGLTWKKCPVDLGKIDYFNAFFRRIV